MRRSPTWRGRAAVRWAAAACGGSCGRAGWGRGGGDAVIRARGAGRGVLDPIFAGEPVGTLFLPHGSTVPAWKRWLGYTAQPRGKLVVDAGALQAVQDRGRSLLPIGVLQVVGNFGKGDVVALCDAAGTEFARGLSNYSAADAARLCG